MKEELSSYRVVRIEKAERKNEFDEDGNPVLPNWDVAQFDEAQGMAKEAIRRRVQEIEVNEGPVVPRKEALSNPKQTQLGKALDELTEMETDPRYCYVLEQFHQQTEKVTKGKHGYYDMKNQLVERLESPKKSGDKQKGKDKERKKDKDSDRGREKDRGRDKGKGREKERGGDREKKRRDSVSLFNNSRPHPTHHKDEKEEKSKKIAVCITAFFKRTPREGIDIEALYHEFKSGSLNSMNNPANGSPPLRTAQNGMLYPAPNQTQHFPQQQHPQMMQGGTGYQQQHQYRDPHPQQPQARLQPQAQLQPPLQVHPQQQYQQQYQPQQPQQPHPRIAQQQQQQQQLPPPPPPPKAPQAGPQARLQPIIKQGDKKGAGAQIHQQDKSKGNGQKETRIKQVAHRDRSGSRGRVYDSSSSSSSPSDCQSDYTDDENTPPSSVSEYSPGEGRRDRGVSKTRARSRSRSQRRDSSVKRFHRKEPNPKAFGIDENERRPYAQFGKTPMVVNPPRPTVDGHSYGSAPPPPPPPPSPPSTINAAPVVREIHYFHTPKGTREAEDHIRDEERRREARLRSETFNGYEAARPRPSPVFMDEASSTEVDEDLRYRHSQLRKDSETPSSSDYGRYTGRPPVVLPARGPGVNRRRSEYGYPATSGPTSRDDDRAPRQYTIQRRGSPERDYGRDYGREYGREYEREPVRTTHHGDDASRQRRWR